MAVLGIDLLTLADAKKFLPHEVGDVAEIMRKAVPIIDDIPYIEMNKGVKHVVPLLSNSIGIRLFNFGGVGAGESAPHRLFSLQI